MELGADENKTIMIGDTAADVRAGKSAHCSTIGVSYGWYESDRVKIESPDFQVDSPTELLAAYNKITSSNS